MELKTAPTKAVRRWHFVAGLCLIHGFRYGAELGVSQGRFTTFLCAVMGDMRMIAVDSWRERPENHTEGSQTYVGWTHEDSYQQFKRHCDKWLKDRVDIRRMDTVEAAKTVLDGSLDFVFIDADHSYEGCKADIQAWTPKVRKNGMISGHDFNWPTVRQAVTESFQRVVVGPDNVWLAFQ